MSGIGEWRYSSTVSLNSALEGVGYITPQPLYSPETDPEDHCRENWVALRASLGGCGEGKMSYNYRGSIPGPYNTQQGHVSTTLSRPTLYIYIQLIYTHNTGGYVQMLQ